MRHNLDRFPKIIASTLALDNVLVDLSGGDVVLAGQGDVEISLVVPEIKVDFTAIVEDKAFSVPGRLVSPSKPGFRRVTERTYSVGAMVPASTFMYGSILIEETCEAHQSDRPVDAYITNLSSAQ
jgi:hypothetical protein